MDPRIWSYIVLNVRDALTEILPDAKTKFSDNTEIYMKEIEQLENYANNVLTSVPQKKPCTINFSHDAFNYFGQAYGYNVIGIQGISTESEAGLKRISELVDLIIEKNIQAVFVETSVSDRNIRALVEGPELRDMKSVLGVSYFLMRWVNLVVMKEHISV